MRVQSVVYALWALILGMSMVSGAKAAQKNSGKSPSKVPTYDEYVALSIRNNWHPVDPVEKLMSTVQKYGQLYDVVGSNESAELEQFAAMMGQEVKYLLTILSKAKERQIDLTEAIHASINIVPEVIYRKLKLGLSSGESRMVTRSEIANNLNHWMYAPLRELVKLSAARIPHIAMNVNARNTSIDASSCLEKVTKQRLYGLISVFLELGADAASIAGALRVAVIQADDLALSLLLNGLVRVYPHIQMEVRKSIDELIALADQLHYGYLAARLRSVLQKREAGAAPLPVHNEYLPYHWQERGADCSGNSDTRTVAGYSPPSFSHTTEAPPVTQEFVSTPQCAVDRVDIADITVEQFYNDYVLLNRPVLLTAAQRTGDGAEVAAGTSASATVWDLEELLRTHGDVKEISSAIPYATLFGHSEEVVTLSEFVSHAETGMRAYSARLASRFPRGCAAVGASELVQAAQDLGLPRYIFSGVQQNLNKAMRGHMLDAVLAFGADREEPATVDVSVDTDGDYMRDQELSRGKLLRFMQAVSATRTNETAPSIDTTASAFKPGWKSQFFLGPALSGAPFHHHGPAFNLVVQGRKEWTLLPPGRDIYSSAHPLEWLAAGGVNADYYPYREDKPPAGPSKEGSAAEQAGQIAVDRPCKLIQRAGEVLYVPRHWTHQVLNLAESVGFAIEIDDHIA